MSSVTPTAATPPTDPDDSLARTLRTSLRRKKERGSHDRALADAVLDEGLVCHVGFEVAGSPYVVPMTYARIDDVLYLHGASGNRMLRHLADGAELCVTVTLLDALVLARSAFHHSMNYRSVMLFGTGVAVKDNDEKRRASLALLEHLAAGRSSDARPPTDEELRTTLIVRLAIEEGSVKVRTGGPIDDDEDLDLPVWAGHLPLMMIAGAGVADGTLPPGTATPAYVQAYPRRNAPDSSRD
jgi:hypothetical protein